MEHKEECWQNVFMLESMVQFSLPFIWNIHDSSYNLTNNDMNEDKKQQ